MDRAGYVQPDVLGHAVILVHAQHMGHAEKVIVTRYGGGLAV